MSQNDEQMEVNGKFYPKWMIEEANELVYEIGGTIEMALETIAQAEEAWENRTPSSSDEPIRVIALVFTRYSIEGDQNVSGE